MKKTELSVIIPCYNEEKNIPVIFRRIEQTLSSDTDVEIIFVNNGSDDDSNKVFKKELEKTNKNIKVIDVEVNQGYGYGILYGLSKASADVLCWTHADLQTDFYDTMRAYELYKKFETQKPFVKGKRIRRMPSEYILTIGMQLLSSIALKTYLSDINSQPKLFSREFYEKYVKDNAPNDFSLDLYVLYQAKKHVTIKEFPVIFNKRLYGEAKGGGASFKTKLIIIKRTIKYILLLRKSIYNKVKT